jgi:hypothetical protein
MRFVTQLAAVAAVVGLSSVAGAATEYNVAVPGGFAPLNANGEPSTIPNAGFVVSTENSTTLALGAHLRFTGPTVFSEQIGGKTVYNVPAGGFPGSPGLALWNVNSSAAGSFASGRVTIDFDPTAGVNTVAYTFTAPGQASENLGFDYWQTLLNAPAFDPNALGDYDIAITLLDGNGGVLNSVEATYRVVAVPVPAAAMAGFALLGGIGAFRRVRRQA